jgi:hypothetical protein
MIESLLPLLLILAGLYLWQNALRARELARDLGRDLCASARVQLLDQTVALQRLRLVRVPARGLLLRRDYGFEFSIEGSDRHKGAMSVIDGRLLSHNMPLDGQPPPLRDSNIVCLPAPERRH